MAEFKVLGPFRIDIDQLPAGRIIKINDFWKSSPELQAIADSKGIYVFAVKPPKSTSATPCYVGKATKTFAQEAFTDRNLLKYNCSLARYKSGYPLIFFVTHPTGKGNTNKKQIGEIESYLISQGYAVNPKIENDRGTKQPQWSIGGVVRGSTKKASASAKKFAAAFGLEKKK